MAKMQVLLLGFIGCFSRQYGGHSGDHPVLLVSSLSSPLVLWPLIKKHHPKHPTLSSVQATQDDQLRLL
jgi:hypothetical protein